jgi:hypothetical protein
MSQTAMSFRYVDDSGQTVVFVSESIVPLGLESLSRSTREAGSYHLSCRTNLVEFPDESSRLEGSRLVSFEMTFPRIPCVYALVEGGWLPPALLKSQRLILDKNIMSTLARPVDASAPEYAHGIEWWIGREEGAELILNPVLCALEPESRAEPSLQQFAHACDGAAEFLSTRLPRAKIVTYSKAHVEAAYTLVSDFAGRRRLEIQFLMEVAPRLTRRCEAVNLMQLEEQILATADSLGITGKSLTVLAALSCLYERADGGGLLAARQILRPSVSYSAENAYNALSDLRIIEIQISSFGLGEPTNHVCTRDVGIAGLWCMLGARGAKWAQSGGLVMNFSVGADLFERLHPDKLPGLISRLAA